MKIIKKIVKTIPHDDLFTFKPPSEPLNDAGIDEIVGLETFIKLYSLNALDKLKRHFDWRPMTEKGSLVKRLKSYLYKQSDYKMLPLESAKIGEIVSKYTITSKEYALDVTKSFRWEAGDFGDSGSCFFQGRSGIRMDMMDDGRYSALRFFQRDMLQIRKGNSKYYPLFAGIARSWIWTTKISREVKKGLSIEQDVYVVFNGYGANTRWQASFLSAYLGLPMKKVALHNKGNVSGGLYVNQGLGFVIGETSIIETLTELDFGLDVHHCSLR